MNKKQREALAELLSSQLIAISASIQYHSCPNGKTLDACTTANERFVKSREKFVACDGPEDK